MSAYVAILKRKSLGKIYAQCLEESKKMVEEEGVRLIPLDHFGSYERKSQTGIPEPTPEGARALADLIQKAVLKQMYQEESSQNCQDNFLKNEYS